MRKVSNLDHRPICFVNFLNHLSKWRGLYVVLLVFILSSCYSTKRLNYLQSDEYKMHFTNRTGEYLVQPNDILNVTVQSRDPDQAAFFNINAIENRNGQANTASLFLTGYPVDKEGKINLAIVGEVKVSDLTVDEIRELIQKEINNYLVNALVTVKLTSFKVSVLGDVKNPGTNYVYNTQSTIFEALSAAGDLNISGKRKNVKLIRQNGQESIVVNLDLTDPEIIRSPYYFLNPNDVIYVETSKQNVLRNNLGLITVFLSAISTGILVIDYVNSN